MDHRSCLETTVLTAGITAFGPGFCQAAYADPVRSGPDHRASASGAETSL